MVMCLRRDDTQIAVQWDGAELFRYDYLPSCPGLESPRPFFHPVRTLAGDVVSLFRPHDHVWHKGIAWSLPNVGPENFWGGPTYRRGDGYIQLPNNGAMRHEGFDLAAARDDVARVAERLGWVTESGQHLIAERRLIAVTAWPGDAAWALSFQTTMRNVGGRPLRIGSPTTEGRENAGYGGLFWRGPRSFTGGQVITPDGPRGDDAMGRTGPWLGFTGRHDGNGHASTLVFCDLPGNFSYPSRWFVRSTPFACAGPAPFFAQEHPLAAGASLTLRYHIVVADGALEADACAALAGRAAARDPLTAQE